ncbi:uncharacterized protein LOC113128663 [Mastacembelus armatus]|uniref:uncharacterized protein LOC113128663 n=1 Tax=Mastacembelus armatus TaxID=205130 RepID=UPI000E45D0A2|nr:uncharacterized protein LOC113128663 [Mastacembelus armatus]
MIDFAKFLARRELVTTGLSKFDDSPENFRAWQSSFFNATQGLGLTYSEELDLLVKWLGKESSEHVKRIRAVHVTNPRAALHLSWQRLQECYGTPEMVEDALFKRLDSFPRLSPKDNAKLRELGDLLMELLAAKDDGYLPGLAYLDTPRGIKPIVEKLPPRLQEKWLTTTQVLPRQATASHTAKGRKLHSSKVDSRLLYLCTKQSATVDAGTTSTAGSEKKERQLSSSILPCAQENASVREMSSIQNENTAGTKRHSKRT